MRVASRWISVAVSMGVSLCGAVGAARASDETAKLKRSAPRAAKTSPYSLTADSKPDFAGRGEARSESCFNPILGVCLGGTTAKAPVAGPEIMQRPFK